ncbi:uncharacterized protein DNG_04189 [Cephalotrichum gorgonifer]|uniref:Uncharacterized protein n=1 Tax=Cephalotrichum gorgonifer TaxID=2041049 RepID=A0AAE8SUY4_9PEZI|nr:uncharacterized protein DNG_04189 [Cephalotrichum gorgonifer]
MPPPRIHLRPIAVFRKESVWMAEGDDLALYKENLPFIRNFLKHSGIQESDGSLWIGIYRIGTSRERARPAMVVSSPDLKTRKQAKDAIKACSLFQKGGDFAHFAVISKETPPGQLHEPQPTMAIDDQAYDGPDDSVLSWQSTDPVSQGNDQEDIQGLGTLNIYASHTGDSYLCRPIQAAQRSPVKGLKMQSATAGPLLLLDGASYQLTVEHLVDFDRHQRDAVWQHTNDDWDDDDDDYDDYGGDDDDGGYPPLTRMVLDHLDTTYTENEESLSSDDSGISVRSPTPESGSSTHELETHEAPLPDVADSDTTPSQSPSESAIVRSFIVRDHSSPSPQTDHISSPVLCYVSAETDYLLFPVPDASAPGPSATRGPEMVQPSRVFDVQSQTEARQVVVATASLGYVSGTMFPAPIMLRKPGSRHFQTFVCVESDSPMPRGTSGSAVFDAETGLLAGYLVLGCPGTHTCYMLPISDVLAELETLFHFGVQCQIRLNVSPAIKQPTVSGTVAKPTLPAGSLRIYIVYRFLERAFNDLVDRVNEEQILGGESGGERQWVMQKMEVFPVDMATRTVVRPQASHTPGLMANNILSYEAPLAEESPGGQDSPYGRMNWPILNWRPWTQGHAARDLRLVQQKAEQCTACSRIAKEPSWPEALNTSREFPRGDCFLDKRIQEDGKYRDPKKPGLTNKDKLFYCLTDDDTTRSRVWTQVSKFCRQLNYAEVLNPEAAGQRYYPIEKLVRNAWVNEKFIGPSGVVKVAGESKPENPLTPFGLYKYLKDSTPLDPTKMEEGGTYGRRRLV